MHTYVSMVPLSGQYQHEKHIFWKLQEQPWSRPGELSQAVGEDGEEDASDEIIQ